jgi:hypothetical protein
MHNRRQNHNEDEEDKVQKMLDTVFQNSSTWYAFRRRNVTSQSVNPLPGEVMTAVAMRAFLGLLLRRKAVVVVVVCIGL